MVDREEYKALDNVDGDNDGVHDVDDDDDDEDDDDDG